MDKTAHNKKRLIAALETNLGNVSESCLKTGIGRSTYYDWLRSDEGFKSDVENITELTIDFVESKLLTQIEKGNVTAIIFFLKTKGARRGYSENRLIVEDRSETPKERQCFVIGGQTIYFD